MKCSPCGNRFSDFLKTIFLGCRREDGTFYWTRKEYCQWYYKAIFRKWLKSPLTCKLGKHRFDEKSDIGISFVDSKGYGDVWCRDCDRMITLPRDDIPNYLQKRFVALLGR